MQTGGVQLRPSLIHHFLLRIERYQPRQRSGSESVARDGDFPLAEHGLVERCKRGQRALHLLKRQGRTRGDGRSRRGK
jgi:hypothetical protein